MSRTDVIRLVYERFNEKDFEGVLTYCHEDVEHADLLVEGVIVSGKEAILRLWTERFAESSASALPADMFEQGETVVAPVCYQVYDPSGSISGSPMIVVHRFTFRGDRISRIEATVLDDLPEDTKALLLHPS